MLRVGERRWNEMMPREKQRRHKRDSICKKENKKGADGEVTEGRLRDMACEFEKIKYSTITFSPFSSFHNQSRRIEEYLWR